MHSCVFSLLQNSTLTIEEFHSKLQEATNFPLRPFVIPFLKVRVQNARSLHKPGLPMQPGLEAISPDSPQMCTLAFFISPFPVSARDVPIFVFPFLICIIWI